MNIEKKEIVKEMSYDIKERLFKVGKSTAKGLMYGVCKCSYPVLGNLSENLQKRIEKVTRGYYDQTEAYEITTVSNALFTIPLAYYAHNAFMEYVDKHQYLMHYLSELYNHRDYFIYIFFGISAQFVALENEIRSKIIEKYDRKTCASLPGKIVSLPFDLTTYAYDSAKKYVHRIEERLERKYKLHKKRECK